MWIPWSLACVSQRLEPRTLDQSGMGPGIDVCEQCMQPDPDTTTLSMGHTSTAREGQYCCRRCGSSDN